jgi:hypothetical protein
MAPAVKSSQEHKNNFTPANGAFSVAASRVWYLVIDCTPIHRPASTIETPHSPAGQFETL